MSSLTGGFFSMFSWLKKHGLRILFARLPAENKRRIGGAFSDLRAPGMSGFSQ
jgi:hypothetical protein